MMQSTMTPEQQAIMKQALLEIAHGAWYRAGNRSKRFCREDMVEHARRAALKCGLDWSPAKPEKPPAETGFAAFIAAGQGGQ